jgi:hypothetical protein
MVPLIPFQIIPETLKEDPVLSLLVKTGRSNTRTLRC